MLSACQSRSRDAGLSEAFQESLSLLQAGGAPLGSGRGATSTGSPSSGARTGSGTWTPAPAGVGAPGAVSWDSSDPSTSASLPSSIQLILRVQAPLGMDAVSIREDLISGYREHGVASFGRLRFPCAAILWDPERQLLILLRDQLGVEPLYYTDASVATAVARAGDLALVGVANSLTVLARLMPAQAQVDDGAMADLLLGTFLEHDATAYRGIHAVVPGEVVEIDVRGRATRRPYWRLPRSRGSGLVVSARDQARVVDELGSLMRLAVLNSLGEEGHQPCAGKGHVLGQGQGEDQGQGRGRSGSQNPVGRLGCFLSGGLDSSAVAGLAASLLNARQAPRLTTLSLRFPGYPEADEGRYLGAFTRRFAVDRRELAFPGIDPLGHLEGLNQACGQPMLMGNHIYSSLLAGMAKAAGCTAVLTGHDGDTVFGYRTLHGADLLRRGYPGRALSWWLQLSRYHCQPKRLVLREQVLQPLWRRAQARLGVTPRFERGTTLAVADLLERSGAWERARAQWVGRSTRALSAGEEHHRELSSASVTQATTFLAHLGQSHDLEIRHPLLQIDLVEYCASLPAAAMTGDGWGRSAVRQAMQGLLPRRLAWRRRKANLSRPLYQALATAGIGTAMGLAGSLAPPRLWEYADRQAVEALLSRLSQMNSQDLDDTSTAGIWPLLWMAQWLRSLPT